MSEEIEYGASGAGLGANIAMAGIGGPAAIIAGAVIGGLFGSSQKRKRKKAERESRRLKGVELSSRAYEIGRTERQRASRERAMYGAGGMSTKSGSAAAVEEGIMTEAIYQQEAVLAGLPYDQKGRNPFRAIG